MEDDPPIDLTGPEPEWLDGQPTDAEIVAQLARHDAMQPGADIIECSADEEDSGPNG